ncbi:hypothetical protein ACIGHE_02900 [Staphylococcus pasteuri]|uniref:hypothetical protein n=1 Tax=Staphylococcus TaxID=1279 RepID=UPI0008A492BD|nr:MULTISPECIES: hypothetical protein [Staphylococcus]OFV13302.1 hypothetical protein HMPREF3125_00480 [Staphylococcus sp. HMSC13A10]
MEIIDCIIDSHQVTYRVKTVQNHTFEHTLSIETPTYRAIEILKLLSTHVDKKNESSKAILYS